MHSRLLSTFAQSSFSNLDSITSFYWPVSPYKNLRILWRKGIILYNYFNRRLRSLSKFFAGFYQDLYSAFSFRQRSLFDSLSFRVFPLFGHDLLESADHLFLSLPKAFPDEFLLLFPEHPFQRMFKPSQASLLFPHENMFSASRHILRKLPSPQKYHIHLQFSQKEPF